MTRVSISPSCDPEDFLPEVLTKINELFSTIYIYIYVYIYIYIYICMYV